MVLAIADERITKGDIVCLHYTLDSVTISEMYCSRVGPDIVLGSDLAMGIALDDATQGEQVRVTKGGEASVAAVMEPHVKGNTVQLAQLRAKTSIAVALGCAPSDIRGPRHLLRGSTIDSHWLGHLGLATMPGRESVWWTKLANPPEGFEAVSMMCGLYTVPRVEAALDSTLTILGYQHLTHDHVTPCPPCFSSGRSRGRKCVVCEGAGRLRLYPYSYRFVLGRPAGAIGRIFDLF